MKSTSCQKASANESSLTEKQDPRVENGVVANMSSSIKFGTTTV